MKSFEYSPTTRDQVLEQGIGFSVSIPCDTGQVKHATLALREFLTAQGVNHEDTAALEMAVTEALNNATLHSNASQAAQPLGLEAVLTPGRAQLQIADHTSGFELPQEFALPADDQIHGRGLFMMRSAVDEWDYLRGSNGNRLVLVRNIKKLTPPPSDAAPSSELAAAEATLESMTEELSSCYESLSAIYCFSQELGRVQDTREFAGQVLGHLLRITSAEWFCCRLYDRDSGSLKTLVHAKGTKEPVEVALSDDTSLESLEVTAAKTRRDQWFGFGKPLSESDPLASFGSGESGLVHACFLEDELAGVITVGTNGPETGLSSGDMNIFHTFADFLMIHLINRRYQEDAMRARLLEGELEIATQIQRSLSPSRLPELGGCGLAGWCRSARKVGGDFFDALRDGDKGLLLVVADVMGKGIPAALFAVVLRSVIRAVPQLWDSPGKLMTHANRVLYRDLDKNERFITAQLVYVSPQERVITHASAGHWPALACAPESDSPKLLENDDPPLGLAPDLEFEERSEPLTPGIRLAMHTDGIVDALNPNGERFGSDRIYRWLENGAHEQIRADHLCDQLVSALKAFEGDVDQSDDQTTLLLAFEPDSKAQWGAWDSAD